MTDRRARDGSGGGGDGPVDRGPGGETPGEDATSGGGGTADGTGASSSTLRRTLAGAAGAGALFLGLGLYLNLATGFSPAENLGPLLMLVLVGATAGGLVAPLAGRLLDRWRGRDPDA